MNSDTSQSGHGRARSAGRPAQRIPDPRFNPAMLTLAREAKGLTQSQLASALGFSQSTIGKWENGLACPTDQELAGVAAALDTQAELLRIDTSRHLASLSNFYHRALAKARRSDLKILHAQCSIRDIQIDRLLHYAPINEDCIPSIDPDNHAGDIGRVAAMARSAMGLSPGPIFNLTETIEQNGGIVVDEDMQADGVDALCRWMPAMPKIFFVNGTKPADRLRFSLAHELGHTVMHFQRDRDLKQAEDEANRFAAEFLMPARDIRRDFRPSMRLADYVPLKEKWRTSIQSLVRRSYDVGTIPENRYKFLCIEISKNGWRTTEPVRIPGEKPSAFRSLVRYHMEGGYSLDDLAGVLCLSRRATEQLVQYLDVENQRPCGATLRLVR